MWIKHPRKGTKDTMLSLSVYAFGIVAIKFLLNGVSFGSFDAGTTDASLIAALLSPTLAAYTARKHSDNVSKKKEE